MFFLRRARRYFLSEANFAKSSWMIYKTRRTFPEIRLAQEISLARTQEEHAGFRGRLDLPARLNRLTGHSPGFFSVYTLPPNQAVSVKSQKKINAQRQPIPAAPLRADLILKKTRNLLGDCTTAVRETLAGVAPKSLLLTQPASHTPQDSLRLHRAGRHLAALPRRR